MNTPGVAESSDALVGKMEGELKALVERLVDSTGADAVTLYLYDAERDTLFLPVAYGLQDQNSFKFSVPRSDRIAGKVAKGRRPIVADDAKSHPDMSGPFTFRERIVSSGGFPIFAGSSVVGVCFISYRRPHPFTADQQAAIQAQLAQLGPALTPAAVARVGQRLIPKLPELSMVDKGLAFLISSACNFIHAPFAIWALDSRTGKLVVRAATGLRRQFVDSASLDPAGDNLLTRVVRTGQPVAATDLPANPRFPFPQEAEHENWQSILAVPISVGGQAGGLLAVFSFTRRDFADWESNFMVELAGQAGDVLMREESFSQNALDPDQTARALAARSALDQTLHLIVEKAAAAFRADIVTLYPYDQDREEFGTPMAQGVFDDFWQHPAPSKTGIAARIAREGEPILSDDAEHDPLMSRGFIERQRVKSSAGCPLKIGNEVVGVLFINYRTPFKFTPVHHDQLTLFANSAAMAIYNARLFAEERRRTEMAEFANTFNETLDRGKTLQAVVDKARALTGGISSSIFLWNSDKSGFELCARSPAPGQEPSGSPRSDHGLTRSIVDTGKPVRIGNAAADPRVREGVRSEGIQSILGVPVQVKGDRVGVLYVNSEKEKHFSQRDEDLIQGLANYGALAIERTRVLEAIRNVNQAAVDFLRLDDLVKEFLKRIVEELHFEFAALQLVNPERNEFETVDGINAPWGAEARHSLAGKDIQAYIVRTFVPIIVTGEQEMTVVGTVEAGFNRSQRAEISGQEQMALEELVADYAPRFKKARLLHVLETIVDNAVRLIRADSGSIHVLNQVAEPKSHYVYEGCAGIIGHEFLAAYPPREDGINRKALEQGHYEKIDDPAALRAANANIYAPSELWDAYPLKYPRDKGVRALACFPLVTGGKYEGVFYVHFWREHQFTDDEIAWLELFAGQVSVAIQEAQIFDKLRDRSQALTSLSVIGQRVVESLTDELRLKPLLEMIAQHAQSALHADLVTLYEYDQVNQANQGFSCPPTMVGDREQAYMISGVDKDDAQAVLVRRGRNTYAPDSTKEAILYNPNRVRPDEKGKPFVEREGIQSSAGVLLKVRKNVQGEARDEIVGVMFVNYRSQRDFTDSERRVIENFASYAAIAIQAARTAARRTAEELEAIHEIDLGIVSGLDRNPVLKLIVETGMRHLKVEDGYGVLHLFDEDSQQLEVCAYSSLPEGAAGRKLRLSDTEAASRSGAARATLLLPNDQPAQPFTPLAAGVCTELAAPLLHGSRLVGVLTIGSRKRDAFDETDRRFLELLAGQAVVAINHAERAKLLEQLRSVLADIASAKDWPTALERVAESSLRVLKADDALIIPYDPESQKPLMGQVVHKRRPGLPEASFKLNLPKEGGIADAVLTQGLVAVNDISLPPKEVSDVQGVAGLGKYGVRAFVGVALEVRNQREESALGVLYVDYRDPHPFTHAELDLLRIFAEEAAIIIQKARQEAQRRQLLQLQADLNSFGGGFAHRVGNRLGTLPVIFGNMKDAIRSGDADAVEEYLQLLEGDVEAVKRIIKAARILRDSQGQPAPCNLNRCIQDALGQIGRRPGVVFDPQLGSNLPMISANDTVISYLLADLMDNALRAMPDGGRLLVSSCVSPDRQWVVAEVSDNGKGMSERLLAQINSGQPFVSDGSGHWGLGLWLARQTMTNFRGMIEAKSEVGKGTTITLRFPC